MRTYLNLDNGLVLYRIVPAMIRFFNNKKNDMVKILERLLVELLVSNHKVKYLDAIILVSINVEMNYRMRKKGTTPEYKAPPNPHITVVVGRRFGVNLGRSLVYFHAVGLIEDLNKSLRAEPISTISVGANILCISRFSEYHSNYFTQSLPISIRHLNSLTGLGRLQSVKISVERC